MNWNLLFCVQFKVAFEAYEPSHQKRKGFCVRLHRLIRPALNNITFTPAEILVSDEYFEQSCTPGRSESPAVENALQLAMGRALKELFENKGLYQNLRLDDAEFKKVVPNTLIDEFRKRPFIPYCRSGTLRMGGAPSLGTPTDELPIGYYLPTVMLPCPICTHVASYLSHACSNSYRLQDPYPLLGADTEQVWPMYYQCSVCRKHNIVFQVLRKGLKLQLTGRSTAFRPAIAKEWPKEIREIIEDAFVAVAEGDVAAGYYHLRTAIEFYLKSCLVIPFTAKVDGTELCDKYNSQADDRLKQSFPTFGPMYSELSLGLHSREVTAERFTKVSNDFLGHLQAKALFATFAVQQPH